MPEPASPPAQASTQPPVAPDAVDWPKVFEDERQLLSGGPEAPYHTGICLSGGGIRSATVSLGVLQVLAEKRLLRHIDYISSVSGGGYIGATLALRYAQTGTQARQKKSLDANFPFPEHGPGLDRLRHTANYLAPTGMSGLLTGFFVVARSLLLNLFIWLFVGAAAFAVLIWLFQENGNACMFPLNDDTTCGWNGLFDWLLVIALALAVTLALLAAGFSMSGWRLTVSTSGADGADVHSGSRVLFAFAAVALVVALRAGVDGPLWFIAAVPASVVVVAGVMPLVGRKGWPTLVLGGVAILAWALFTERAFAGRNQLVGNSMGMVAIAGWILCLCVVIATVRRADPAGTPTPAAGRTEISPKYARRRFIESASGRLLLFIGICLAFGLIPLVAHQAAKAQNASEAGPPVLSVALYLVSGAAALFGFWRTRLKGVLGLGTGFVLIAGSALLLVGTIILSQAIGRQMLKAATGQEALSLLSAAYLAATVLAFALGFLVNVNDVSLGRYYRDRLMEAFMPDRDRPPRDGAAPPDEADDDGAGRVPPATEADRFRLTQIVGRTGEQSLAAPEKASLYGPYPLINAHLVARRSPDAITRRRGGDAFLLSPLYCGSSETGWKRTETLIEGELTLPTAMAISGAAANPGGGLAGRGPTANVVVAVAMALLSLRLGYRFRWHNEMGLLRKLNPFGNHFVPAASEIGLEILGRRGTRDPAFVELSDGGHFENLGIYELVRRRCGLIIVCDGGQDPSSSYEAFISAMTLVREDFGVEFRLDMRVRSGVALERSGPEQVVSRRVDDQYPKEVEFSRRGYFLATVRYPRQNGRGARGRLDMAPEGPSTGLVIYLKSAMIPSLSPSSRGYRGANPEFPYETTADQFFSPEQFEAYRDVGQKIARQMLEETDLDELFRHGRPTVKQLYRSSLFEWMDWRAREPAPARGAAMDNRPVDQQA